MPMNVRHAGAIRTIRSLHVRHAGVIRFVREAWVKHGGTWRRFFAALAIAMFDPSRTRSVTGASLVEPTGSVTITGGTGPYTYQWTWASQGDGSVSYSNVSAASPNATLIVPFTPSFDTFTLTCTVTDTATGAQASGSITVDVTFNQ